MSLPNSNFEIDTDANLKLDDPAPSIDWATVSEDRKADSPSGANDESFGQGTKEDTAVPSVVDGSIPPNKSDLKFFGLYQEGNTSSGFLNLFWSRVQDPSGTTNMDFELNKRQCTPNQNPADADCSANGLTPKRTSGDVLIQYDLSQGGTHPVLFVSRWIDGTETPTPATKDDCEASNSLPCWSKKEDLTAAGDATGSINTSPIPANESDGLGAHSARTFGEAQVALSALFGSGTCQSFGSAYLKSRSSDSFTAALKDFVPPKDISVGNCGTLNIQKYIDVNENGVKNTGEATLTTANPAGSVLPGDLTSWSFTVKQNGTDVCTGSTDATGKVSSCLNGNTAVDLTTLPQGSYTVQENANASKTIGSSPGAAFFNLDPGSDGTDGGTTAAAPPVSETASVSVGGTTNVDFGNSCYATARFEVTGVPSGQTGLFVRYTITAGPDQNFPTTADVLLTQDPNTSTTYKASVANLRKGDSISWSFGINHGLQNEQTQSVSTPISLSGYPSCGGSGSAQFQTATVSSLKYKDIDADGTQDSGEGGLQGFSFELKSGSNVVATTKSGATGTISFSNVAPGTYTIHEVKPLAAGWAQTEPANNGDVTVTVNLGDTSKTAGSFGNTPLSTIDVKFNSLAKLLNANGTESTTPATKATAISCKDASASGVGSNTDSNTLTTDNLKLNQSKVMCEITFTDP